MDPKVLAELVAEVLKTRSHRQLSDEQRVRFYREFESEVYDKVEKIRSEKRKAYEELKNIAIG